MQSILKHKGLKIFLLVVLLLLSVVLGKVIGSCCKSVTYLSWLALSAKFGLQPTRIDLSVIQLTFGAVIDINVAQALLLLLAILIYSRARVHD